MKEQNAEGKQGRENIKKLLLSGDAENLTLALQLIEGGGFSPDFKNELFIAYQFAVDSTIKKNIKEEKNKHAHQNYLNLSRDKLVHECRKKMKFWLHME